MNWRQEVISNVEKIAPGKYEPGCAMWSVFEWYAKQFKEKLPLVRVDVSKTEIQLSWRGD